MEVLGRFGDGRENTTYRHDRVASIGLTLFLKKKKKLDKTNKQTNKPISNFLKVLGCNHAGRPRCGGIPERREHLG